MSLLSLLLDKHHTGTLTGCRFVSFFNCRANVKLFALAEELADASAAAYMHNVVATYRYRSAEDIQKKHMYLNVPLFAPDAPWISSSDVF